MQKFAVNQFFSTHINSVSQLDVSNYKGQELAIGIDIGVIN